ncbi:MAG TPA: hypothetical protein VII13_08365 [Vicinamibacteria bacterium]|jgi:hypothetical protein
MRRAVPLLALLALPRCSPTTADGFPEVTGTYVGILRVEFTEPATGTTTGQCPETLVITSQSGATVSGGFERGAPCAASAGPVRGTLDQGGGVVLDFEDTQGFQGFSGCTYVSGDRSWRGTLRDDELDIALSAVLSCTGFSVPLQTSATLTAVRRD